MNVTLLADVHIGYANRLNDILWALNRVLDYNSKHNIDITIIAGDLLHDRDSINVKDLCALSDFFEKANSNGQRLICFPGNHDMYLRNSWDINSIKPFRAYFDYIDSVDNITVGGRKIWIIPFVHYEDQYMKELKSINDNASEDDILITHIGVNNAVMNSCFLLKSWSTVNFGGTKFKKIFAGHFHNHQKIGDNFWYIGSPIPFKFDEGNVDHGFIDLNLDDCSHKFISIWDGALESSDVPPQFITIDDDSVSDLDQDNLKGNVVRVALSRDYTNDELEDIKNRIVECGAKKVRWMVLKSKEDQLGFELADEDVASIDALFDKYIEQDKNANDLSRKLLVRLNKEIMSEGDRVYEEQSQSI